MNFWTGFLTICGQQQSLLSFSCVIPSIPWFYPDFHLTTIWPSPDPYLTLIEVFRSEKVVLCGLSLLTVSLVLCILSKPCTAAWGASPLASPSYASAALYLKINTCLRPWRLETLNDWKSLFSQWEVLNFSSLIIKNTSYNRTRTLLSLN